MPTIDTFTPRDFAEVLGSVLTGVVDAQARAARSTVDFINEVGIEVGPDNVRRLRAVSFGYRKLDESQDESEFELSVPLLSLVQIPMISLKTAKIEFSYDVHHVEESQAPASAGPTKKTAIIGRIVRKTPVNDSSQKTEATSGLNITIELERGSAPLGIERLLDVMELAVASKPLPAGGG